MPRGKSTGAVAKKYTLDNGVWQWRILAEGDAFNKQQFTEERLTTKGDDMIQLVVKVGDKTHSIIIIENVTFNDAAEWKLNEFLKSAGIYAGEGVDYYITAEMCVGLHGQCNTANKQSGEYTNTKIASWLEAGEQKPESLPGFLSTPTDEEQSAQAEVATPEPIEQDDVPF